MRRLLFFVLISVFFVGESYPHDLTRAKVTEKRDGGGGGGYQPCLLCYDTPGADIVEIKVKPSHFPFKVTDIELSNSSNPGMEITFTGGLSNGKSFGFLISIIKNGQKYQNQIINQNSSLLSNGQLTVQIEYYARYCINGLIYSHTGDPFTISSQVEIENFNPNNGNSLGSSTLTIKSKTSRLYNCNGTLPYKLMMSPFSLNGNNKDHAIQELRYNVYPNPTKDYLLIDFDLWEKSEIKIRVRNSLGETVKFLNTNNYSNPGKQKIKLDLSNLPKGIYFLSLEDNGKLHIKKVIRN